MKYITLALTMALSLLFYGCNDDLDKRATLTFIGDSLIARWDLQESFSSFATTNLGQSGAGIDYIESHAGTMVGRNIVVIIGTNDSWKMSDQYRDEYAKQYINAIIALNANKIYLYSVLPRDFDGDPDLINDDIDAFNKIIMNAVSQYSNIKYLNVYNDFIGNDGMIKEEYYSDRLHLSIPGYETLTNKLMQEF